MKVKEEGSDRSVEMRVCIEGNADPLPEYGEYVDPVDHAVCSYIPLEEGQKPKFNGKFNGTTLDIVCDAFMDGIHRKCYFYGARAVRFQKGKKIEIDKFLFKTEDGFIDSQMVVSTLDMPTTQSDSPETIGTMELRLCCTRRMSVSHEVKGIKQYYTKDNQKPGNEDNDTSNSEGSETSDNEDNQKLGNSKKGNEKTNQIVSYRQIAPTSRLEIVRDSAPISEQAVASYYNKMISSRPGEEPWAIFRFHYRSKEALEKSDIKQSVTLALQLQVKDPFQSKPGDKRPSATINETLPEAKRPKVLPPSPSLNANSLKSQLAERRKKLAELHKNHRQEAETLATIQRKIEPYEQRMMEELERIDQAITEEETALKEVVERRSHFEKVLQEFEDGQDDA
ncbi:hypothetical protein COCCADRAFT_33810 [Bipolaris zeicola 26-R-13]|uniref:Uncharacterized protein n=1 Tax=Cochliobolus carbonum (strain 26-R-13) TaxID=930089 RepID=W6YH31_COCC2|nr:uncharacterized protein COCCADRAFT_33810 [Bipolaris zeicola 26-R-13]EUC36805.1 hypothetical protein COCCADRAFT_33810 [Bipolaris zeicola 26-R-13]